MDGPAAETATTAPLPPPLAEFAAMDWVVLGGYFMLLAATGYLLSRKKVSGGGDYFLAGRQMPAWAVAFSIVATAVSAATFVGAPAQAYAGNLTYLSAQIGQLIAVLIVAAFFIPAFYRANVTTVYELVGTAFGPGARQASSGMFMVGRVFASGARLFMAGLAGSFILFGDTETPHVAMAIGVITFVGIAYTFIGGVRAVIWTDVIQTCVFVGAAVVAIVFLLSRIPAGLGEIYGVLGNAGGGDGAGSKLRVLEVGIDLGPAGGEKPLRGFDVSQSFTLLTALVGFTIFNMAAYGTDHDLTQRVLTCRSAVKGSRATIGAIVLGLPVTLLFMAVGLLLYIFYKQPALMNAGGAGGGAPIYEPEARDVFLEFVMREMTRGGWGLAGLIMAGVIATALSSLNSGLNAMSSTLVNDFYKRTAPGRSERHYLAMGRAAVAGWGIVLGAFACVCIYWQKTNADIGGQSLLGFALGVMTFAYAGLAAVFVTAIFTRRGNGASAVAALAAGFACVLAMQPAVWKAWAPRALSPGLSETTIAFPWALTIAFTVSLIVCCAGKRRQERE
jgi:solute:Na+ symporter, SSS family